MVLVVNEAFGKPLEGPPPKRQRNHFVQKPRSDSLLWIRELDNALRHATKRRVHDFKLEIAKVVALLVTGMLTLTALAATAPILACVLGQAPWHACACSCLRFEC